MKIIFAVDGGQVVSLVFVHGKDSLFDANGLPDFSLMLVVFVLVP